MTADGLRWTSERTLRAGQRRREEGSAVPHLPDAQVRTPKLVGVEVERSPKSDKELDEILTELLITGSPSPIATPGESTHSLSPAALRF